nr:hypothetical protein [Tanacetum cinerariifolium]
QTPDSGISNLLAVGTTFTSSGNLYCQWECLTHFIPNRLQIHQSPRGIFINQAKYALEILHKHGMEKVKALGSSFDLTTFSNADHAGCIDTRKSTSRGIQFLGDKLVSWMSKKQNCTAMSSAEAEYVALSTSCAQVMWMRIQLQDYGFNYNKIPLYCDSQSAIAISCNPVQHSAGGKDRLPMLAPGNYVQWRSRIKRYIDTKPNHELIHYCLKNPLYKFTWADKEVPVTKGSSVTTKRYMENYKNVSQDIRDQLNAKAKVVQIILIGIDNDIYSTFDACPITCEMWKAIERLKQGELINVQDLETSLYWEFRKFTSRDGESLKSYYSRFYKMVNELVRNQCDVTNHQVNVQFLLQLQLECRANQDNSPRISKGTGYDNQRKGNVDGARETVGKKMLLCKQEEAGFQLNVEQADWRDDTDDEPEDQELEAHYIEQLDQDDDYDDLANEEMKKELFAHQETISILSQVKESQNKLYKTYDDKELDKVIALENKVKSAERYFSERSNMCHTHVNNENSKESFNKQTTLLEKRMDESIPYDQKCKISKELFKIKRSVVMIFNGVEHFKETIAKRTYFGHIDPFIQNTIEANFCLEIRRINADLEKFHLCLKEEMVADLRYFNSLELEVDSLKSQLETQKTQFLIEIDRLSREYYYAYHMNAILGVYTELDELVEIILFIIYSRCSKHMTGNLKLLTNFVEKFLGTVKFYNDQIAQILGYGDLNCTLVEDARTMLSAAKVPVFIWAEAITTTCFTQNCSLVIPRHEKTPYHIINDRKPSVKFFHIFGSLCYIARDGENLDKMKEKGDACIFVGYSTQSRAYRVFNKRTRVIVETIHVNFDELRQMALDHVSSDPVPQCERTTLEHDSLSPSPHCQENVPHVARTVTTSNKLDLLFSSMFNELLNGSSQVVSKSSAETTSDAPNQRQQQNTTPLNTQTTPDPSCHVPTQASTVTSTENINQVETIEKMHKLKMTDLSTSFVHRYKTEGRHPRTRRQLESDGEMCMFTLTVSRTEPKNIKEAMADSAWIQSMQEELHQFDRLDIHQSPRGIFVNQAKYSQEILIKQGMTSCDSIGTLMAAKHLDADLSGTSVDQTKYRSMVGALVYLTTSRPDIVHAICYCARYQVNPTEKHLTAIKRIFRLDSRERTSGGIQFLGGDKLVSSSSKKQDCTSMSLAEAEYVSLSACCAKVLWMRTQLTDYDFHFDKIPMCCNSKAAIAISCNPFQHSRTKHIDVRYHFIKEKVEKGIVELFFVETEYQLADLFSKALPEDRFKYLVRRLGMRCLTPEELKVAASSILRLLKPKVHKSSVEPRRDPIINLLRTQSMYNTCCSSINNICEDGNPARANIKQALGSIRRSYALSWKPCQGDSLNLPDH